MQQEPAFYFRTGAVVAGAYYRVVGARLVDEIAAVVDQVRVDDVTLAILDVILLAFVGGKAAAAAIAAMRRRLNSTGSLRGRPSCTSRAAR